MDAADADADAAADAAADAEAPDVSRAGVVLDVGLGPPAEGEAANGCAARNGAGALTTGSGAAGGGSRVVVGVAGSCEPAPTGVAVWAVVETGADRSSCNDSIIERTAGASRPVTPAHAVDATRTAAAGSTTHRVKRCRRSRLRVRKRAR